MAKWDMERIDLVPRGRAQKKPAPGQDITVELQEIRARVEQMLMRGAERAHPLDGTDWHILTNINARLTQLINDRGE